MKTMKKLWILMAALTATLLLCVVSASACTMVYVGSNLTADGSSFMARSEDYSNSYNKIAYVNPTGKYAAGSTYNGCYGFTHTFTNSSPYSWPEPSPDNTKTTSCDSTFTTAYAALQKANIELGINYVQEAASAVPEDDTIKVKARSIMGTEIPLVQHEPQPLSLTYACFSSRESLDEAREKFEKVKELTIRLSMVENSAYRLAGSIRKTQKRANALKNITIPMYQALVTNISNALEEKDREEFTRLKVIKRMKN